MRLTWEGPWTNPQGTLRSALWQHFSLLSVGLAVGVSVIHVLTVGARMGESLETLGTLEGLLATVESLVLRQMVLVLEGLRTLGTLVRSLTCNIRKTEDKNKIPILRENH